MSPTAASRFRHVLPLIPGLATTLAWVVDAAYRGSPSLPWALASAAALTVFSVHRWHRQRPPSQSRAPEDSPAFLHSLLDNIPNMIFVKDAQSLRFIAFNRAGERLLGYQRSELIGKNDYDFFPKDQADFFTEKDRQVLAGGVLVDIKEEPIETRHQGSRILHTKKIPVLDESGQPRYLLGISEDITELKQAQREIAVQRAKMIASSRMAEVGKMAGGIAHELNTPLGTITGRAEHIQSLVENGAPPARLLADAQAILKTGFRMASIIKSLRAIARETDGETYRTVAVGVLVEDVLSLCRERFRHQNIHLTSHCPEGLQVECRPIQLSHVLLNLLNNACDALEGTAAKTITLTVALRQEQVQFEVADNGPGVPQALQQSIFQPFFTTKEIGKGTGIGLNIAQGIVESHGGTLALESKAGATRFHFTIPRTQDQRRSQAA